MARKSSKTNHVLNLLSSGSGDGDGKTDLGTKPPVNPEAESVSVVKKTAEKEKVSETIRASLEKELTETVEVEEVAEEMNVKKEVVEEVIEDVAAEEIEDSVDGVVEDTTSEVETKVAAKDGIKEENPSKKSEEEDCGEEVFSFVSVMEYLVKSQLEEYMDRFSSCKCSRCVADVTALALTNLPPKYVVREGTDVSPLLNYYYNKYYERVMIELTKACIQVDKRPNHK